MRKAVASPIQVAAATGSKTFPAPIRGWIEDENLARNQGMACSVLENCFPLQNTVRVRKGTGDHVATVGAAVKSMIPYTSGTTEKLFASTATALYDISTFGPSVPTPAWTQLTSGEFSFVQMDTGGGQFLVMANGDDPLLYYNGSAWFPILDGDVGTLAFDALTQAFVVGRTLTGATSSSTATIVGVTGTGTTGTLYLSDISAPFVDNETVTGSSSGGSATAMGASDDDASTVAVTGVNTDALSFLWIYKSRIFAVEKDTMVAWYGEIDTLIGTANDINLGGVFTKGGSLLFGGTWSSDSGDGFNDRCVFVSTLGEVAVYSGDPDGDDWTIVGHYDVGNPVTVQTWKAGGDFLIATTDGIVPMSAIVQKDPSVLETAAVTYPIKNAWQRVARSNSSALPTQLLKWQKSSMGIVGYPHRTGSTSETHVVNLATGAWAKWTGLDVQCMAVYQDQAYFGTSDGKIYHFEGGGSDGGLPYVARGSMLPDDMGAPGAIKTARVARATFRALRPFGAKLSAATDYGTNFPSPPSSVLEDDLPGIWDVGEWDVSNWDDSDLSEVRETKQTRWRSIGRTGYAIAPQWQITCGGARTADAELVQIDMTYTVGGTVV